MFIKNIPIYDYLAEEKYCKNIIKTNIKSDDIEEKINKILDKHSNTCKYYININDSTWVVSFNVGIDQIEAMIKTMFEIRIFKDENNLVKIYFSEEIKEHEQWAEIYNDLIKNLL